MRGIDAFVHDDDDEAQAALSALLAEAFADPTAWERVTRRQVAEVLALESRTTAAAVIDAPAEQHEALVLALGARLDAIVKRPGYYSGTTFCAYSRDPHWQHHNVLELLFKRLLRRRLSYGEGTLGALVGVAQRHHALSAAAIVGHVERCLDGQPAKGALRRSLLALQETIHRGRRNEKTHERLDGLLALEKTRVSNAPPPARSTGQADPLQLLAGIDKPWLDVLRNAIQQQPRAQEGWRALLALAWSSRERSRPTKSLLADLHRAVQAIGETRSLRTLVLVFEAASEPTNGSTALTTGQLTDSELFRALAWSVGAMAGAKLPPALIAGLQNATSTLFSRGAVDLKAGGGCITALGLLAAGGHNEAVVALLELGQRIEYQRGQDAVRRALCRAASARHISVDALSRQAITLRRSAGGPYRSATPCPICGALPSGLRQAVATQTRAEDAQRAEQVEAALGTALVACKGGDLPLALHGVLDAWRASKSATLAQLVDALSPLAAAGRAPITGKKERRFERWLELVGDLDPADLPRLLDALDRENQRTALEQFRALEAWPADPRLAAALCELLEAPPYRHQRTWTGLVIVLVGQTDPRTKARLQGVDVTLHKRREGDPWRVALGELRRALDIRYPKEHALSARAESLAAELWATLPTPKGPQRHERRIAQQANDLLAAIYDDPTNNDLRRVYADLLLEAGDRRGELINLQLIPDKTAAQRKQERALLAAHAIEWLGPLAPVFQKGGLRYEGGFPVAGRVVGKKLSTHHKLIGLSQWSTFEELAVKGWEVPLRALVHPILRGLRVLEGVDLETAAHLLGPGVRPLTRLRGSFFRDEEDAESVAHWETLLLGVGAPDLRELVVDSSLDRREVESLLTSPLGQRLEHLRFNVGWREVSEWVGWLAKRQDQGPCRLTLHETFRHWNLTLSAGSDGRWSQLHCSHEDRVDEETRGRLDELVGQLPSGVISDLVMPPD